MHPCGVIGGFIYFVSGAERNEFMRKNKIKIIMNFTHKHFLLIKVYNLTKLKLNNKFNHSNFLM